MTSPTENAEQLTFDAATTPTVRTINYLGGKARLLPAISEAVRSVAPPGTMVCDLFSGSAVVARALADDYDVVAADIQEYARVLASAVTAPDLERGLDTEQLVTLSQRHPALESRCVRDLVAYEQSALDEALEGRFDRICDVLEHGSILASGVAPPASTNGLNDLLADTAALETGPHTVLSRFYGGIYFSYRQAAELDALASAARSLSGTKRDVALAAVMIAASEVVSTVGSQFAQPIRPRTATGTPKAAAIKSIIPRRRKSSVRAFRDALARLSAAPQAKHRCDAVRADFRDTLKDLSPETTAVYADPPYTRDHYSRFYHVLETIALGDEPEISTVKIDGKSNLSRGLYRSQRHQSPFCIRTEAAPAFEELFAAIEHRRVRLVLSYSPYGEGAHPRVMTVDDIERLAGKYFSDVQRWRVGRLAHSKLNAERLNFGRSLDAEVLLVCRP